MSEILETLLWLRKNYASAPTAEINARIDAAMEADRRRYLEEVGQVEKVGDHLNVSIDDDLTWMEGEKLYRLRPSREGGA